MAHRHMLLPAVLTLLLRAATAITGCDGSVNVPAACLTLDNTLSYCQCNLCQTYKATEVYGGTPSQGPGISTSYMIPGVQSNHTLCLYHWTFFKVPTRSPGPDGVDEPKGVVFYLDTDFKSEQNRFTTVDVLEVTRDTLPEAWSDVHTLAYPKDAFGLNQIDYSPEGRPVSWRGDGVRFLLKKDSYMYTAGYDDEGEGCRSTQNEFMYVGVRCGDEQDKSGWVWPDQPCKFKVRPVHTVTALADTVTAWAHANAASYAWLHSLQCVWLQRAVRMVAPLQCVSSACSAYGCRLQHVRLQPGPRTVAGEARAPAVRAAWRRYLRQGSHPAGDDALLLAARGRVRRGAHPPRAA